MRFKEQIDEPSSTQICILVYDGECRLCVSAKQKLEEWGVGQAESDFRFITYQSEEAKRVLGSNYRPGRLDAAFLIQPSEKVLRGLEAFLPLAHHFPGGKLLLWGLRFPSVKRMAEWSYGMIACHRYRWFGEADLPRRLD